MGKVRGKVLKRQSVGGRPRVLERDNSLGKISDDIGAISLGPPRTKILKKTGASVAGSSSLAASSSTSLTANLASRVIPQNKAKKKVTFCQNLMGEELKEGASPEGEDAKHYFKVIHPSPLGKTRRQGKPPESMASRVSSVIPGKDVLMSSATSKLTKIIKKGVRIKKVRERARKEAFKKKIELIKANKEELLKAKQRQQTVIVGDMHPILESLPSVEPEPMDDDKPQALPTSSGLTGEMKNIPIPKKTKFSVKKTQKAIMDSLKFFEAAGVGKTAAGLSAN